ncbi:MAG: hypothetical protein PHG65_05810 [Kiritimatiellae bacterium]|nr:hypothetical protein [Kiritimatiellia bacterium]
MKRVWFLQAVFLLGLGGGLARAELSWHALSLKLFAGPTQNGGTIKEEGLEHEYEYGVGAVMAIRQDLEFEMALSKWDVKKNSIATYFEEKANKLSFSGRKKYFYPSLFVPWWQVGADWALIDTYKRYVSVEEHHNEHTDEYSLSALGVHAGVGVDIYPLENSSLAVTLDARYTDYISNSEINQWGAFVGIRWDFFQRGLGRRNYKRIDAGDRKPLQETPLWMR